MTAHKPVQIDESLAELKSLERKSVNPITKARLQFLILLKGNPQPIKELAPHLDKSPRTLYRWLDIYRNSGISALIDKGNEPSTRLTTEQLQALRKLLISGEMESLQDIRQWLKEQFGLEYSLRGVSKLVTQKMRAKRVWQVEAVSSSTAAKQSCSTQLSSRYLQIMNELPVDFDVSVATVKLRNLLQEVLRDVDRVSISVNYACSLHKNEHGDHIWYLSQNGEYINNIRGGNFTEVHQYSFKDPFSQGLLRRMRKYKFPFKDYHSPYCFDYKFLGSEPLGCILLWNKKKNRAIQVDTIQLMKTIHPFIVFILTDTIARYHYANPTSKSFLDLTTSITIEAGVSAHERKIMYYRLYGFSYKEIAAKLNISQSTVKKQIQAVHRKTGTRSHAELFAKYFTPLVLPNHKE